MVTYPRYLLINLYVEYRNIFNVPSSIELYNIYFAAYFGIFMEQEKSYDSHNTNIDIQMCSFIQIFLLNVSIDIYSLDAKRTTPKQEIT